MNSFEGPLERVLLRLRTLSTNTIRSTSTFDRYPCKPRFETSLEGLFSIMRSSETLSPGPRLRPEAHLNEICITCEPQIKPTYSTLVGVCNERF